MAKKILKDEANVKGRKNVLAQIKGILNKWFPKSLKDKKRLRRRDLNFTMLKTYVDKEHMLRRLLRHNPSGELYFYEWYEEIDWANGNDPQYVTYVPVETAEEAEELSCPEVTYYGGGFGDRTRIVDNRYADDKSEFRWIKV